MRFFLCYCTFSAWCLFHTVAWSSSVYLICCSAVFHLRSPSVPPVTVNFGWLWMQLPLPVISGEVFYFSGSINLFHCRSVPVCLCLWSICMCHLENAIHGHRVGLSWLIVFLTALFITPCRQGCFPSLPVAVRVPSSWCCVWLLWQDSKWVEEKQYLIRTNQELHEKVELCISLYSLLMHCFIGNKDAVSSYCILAVLMPSRAWYFFRFF